MSSSELLPSSPPTLSDPECRDEADPRGDFSLSRMKLRNSLGSMFDRRDLRRSAAVPLLLEVFMFGLDLEDEALSTVELSATCWLWLTKVCSPGRKDGRSLSLRGGWAF